MSVVHLGFKKAKAGDFLRPFVLPTRIAGGTEKIWCTQEDSNLRPSDSKSDALSN